MYNINLNNFKYLNKQFGQIFVIKPVMMPPMIFGKIAIKITVNKMHQKYLQIYFLALGPTKSIYIFR